MNGKSEPADGCLTCGALGRRGVVLDLAAGQEVRALVGAESDLVIEVWRREQQYVVADGPGAVAKLVRLVGREVP